MSPQPVDARTWGSGKTAIADAALILTFALFVLWDAFLLYFTMTRTNQNVQDFGRFFYSAQAFLHGEAMYGPSPGTLIQLGPLFAQHMLNLNPPHFHLLLLPFTLLPLHISLLLWEAINLAALLLSLAIIKEEVSWTMSPRGLLLVGLALLAFSGAGFLMLTAQLSPLLLIPFTLAWKNARAERWDQAGWYLGILISLKLFFLIFLPYFLFRRQHRGAGIAVVTAVLVFGAGLAVFGHQAYGAWFRALSSVDWGWSHPNLSILGVLQRTFSESPYFQPLTTGVPIGPIWIGLGSLIGGVTVYAASRDDSPQSVDRGFVLLTLGALLISPLGWIYYLLLAMGPAAALLQTWPWQEHGGQTRSRLRIPGARGLFMILAIPGLVWPVPAATLFQPHPLATVILGSMYWWSTVALWGGVLTDWYGIQRRDLPTHGIGLRPIVPPRLDHRENQAVSRGGRERQDRPPIQAAFDEREPGPPLTRQGR